MYLLVGLGNPGLQYSKNRHNVGFLIIDEIQKEHGFPNYKEKFVGHISENKIKENKVFLLKPQTFMNDSGRSVIEASSFYKISVDNIVVIHDEIDLAPAKVQLKKGGGFAGHKGLESIGNHVGKDFYRIRVGVGHPGEKDLVSGYVLSNFSKDDNQWVSKILKSVSEQIETAILGDENKFNQKMSDGFNTGVSDVTTKIEK